jgi:hypothetical protein
MNLIEEIKAEYELCINNPHQYQSKIDSISNIFSLKGKKRLKGDYCPVYVVGRYQSTPLVLFGLNPGFSSKNSPIEDQEARKSWEDYQDLYLNFFRYFSDQKFESPYYTALGHLLAGLTGDENKSKWDLFDLYLTNLELIPYHSEGISLPAKKSSQIDYLNYRLRSNLDFIIGYKPKLLLFNGKPYHVLLIEHNLIREYQKVEVKNSKDFNIYFFKIEGIPSVLFDKFFQAHFWRITNYDRRVTIPRLFNEKYGSILN